MSRPGLGTEEEEVFGTRMLAVDDRVNVEPRFEPADDATEHRPHLRLHQPPGDGVDVERATAAVADLLDALGIDTAADEIADTPARVARSFAEMLTPEPFEVTTFPNEEGYDELVVARALPFASLCEHHLLPFSGHAYVAYLPDERLVGLSKLARVVDHFARRLQVQERLTAQVANFLQTSLRPKGVGVVLEAEHLCMSLRGVRAEGSRTVTSALKGIVRDDPRTRSEFLSLSGTRQ